MGCESFVLYIDGNSEKGLAKGLNCASAPKCIPTAQIISEVETAIYSLDEGKKSEIRLDVTRILKNAKVPESNLIKEEKFKSFERTFFKHRHRNS